MTCKLCRWLASRFAAGDESPCSFAWQELNAWEHAYLGEHDLCGEEPPAARQLAKRASDIYRSDPLAAFELRCEAADAGSAWAMEIVGWHHEFGRGTPVSQDEAEIAYCRAISAGSWSATIRYAKLLAKCADAGRCEDVLREGVDVDFAPALFWLAWYRYKWLPTRATARDIRPLLERADAFGHPMARRFLGGLMLRGNFGVREIWRGWRLILDDQPRSSPGIMPDDASAHAPIEQDLSKNLAHTPSVRNSLACSSPPTV